MRALGFVYENNIPYTKLLLEFLLILGGLFENIALLYLAVCLKTLISSSFLNVYTKALKRAILTLFVV